MSLLNLCSCVVHVQLFRILSYTQIIQVLWIAFFSFFLQFLLLTFVWIFCWVPFIRRVLSISLCAFTTITISCSLYMSANYLFVILCYILSSLFLSKYVSDLIFSYALKMFVLYFQCPYVLLYVTIGL